MGLLESILICVGLFLLFPKGFKYLVGTWTGAMTGGFLWGLAVIGACMVGIRPSLVAMGWSFLTFIVSGIAAGLVLAARG